MKWRFENTTLKKNSRKIPQVVCVCVCVCVRVCVCGYPYLERTFKYPVVTSSVPGLISLFHVLHVKWSLKTEENKLSFVLPLHQLVYGLTVSWFPDIDSQTSLDYRL